MTSIITADLHLDDSPRNADRWNLFPWLREQIKKHKAKELIVCGDLTDAKDRHASLFTNRFVDEFASLAELTNVYLLRGNHDYIAEDFPFFMFMRRLTSSLDFVRKPTRVKSDVGNLLLLPHTKNWEEQWKKIDFSPFDYVFTHQTFDGARAENGQTLTGGVPPSFFKTFKGKVYSGDVHVPQRLGKNIEYVGAPYRIHFGDGFQPRVLLLPSKGEAVDLHFPSRGRELLICRGLPDLQEAVFPPGTQVKVRVTLRRSEYPGWPKLRGEIAKLAKERDWELCGVELRADAGERRTEVERDEDGGIASPEETLRGYAEAKRLPRDIRAAGLEILKEVEQ